ncbi:MAG: hypothetical protein IJ562_01655 [Prevotella sp.]|nr:hypothetical protein [Prevotella sp.]
MKKILLFMLLAVVCACSSQDDDDALTGEKGIADMEVPVEVNPVSMSELTKALNGKTWYVEEQYEVNVKGEVTLDFRKEHWLGNSLRVIEVRDNNIKMYLSTDALVRNQYETSYTYDERRNLFRTKAEIGGLPSEFIVLSVSDKEIRLFGEPLYGSSKETTYGIYSIQPLDEEVQKAFDTAWNV